MNEMAPIAATIYVIKHHTLNYKWVAIFLVIEISGPPTVDPRWPVSDEKA